MARTTRNMRQFKNIPSDAVNYNVRKIVDSDLDDLRRENQFLRQQVSMLESKIEKIGSVMRQHNNRITEMTNFIIRSSR